MYYAMKLHALLEEADKLGPVEREQFLALLHHDLWKCFCALSNLEMLNRDGELTQTRVTRDTMLCINLLSRYL